MVVEVEGRIRGRKRYRSTMEILMLVTGKEKVMCCLDQAEDHAGRCQHGKRRRKTDESTRQVEETDAVEERTFVSPHLPCFPFDGFENSEVQQQEQYQTNGVTRHLIVKLTSYGYRTDPTAPHKTLVQHRAHKRTVCSRP